MSTIISVDASSTAVGWSYWHDNWIESWGVYRLDGPLGQRCSTIYTFITGLIHSTAHYPDVLSYESPVGSFKGSLIPQVLVQGAILAAAEQSDVLTTEITPKEAKFALTKNGSADKKEMLVFAIRRLGYTPDAFTFCVEKGEWVAQNEGKTFLVEHTADAIGVGVATLPKVVVSSMVDTPVC